jgi:cell wall-associated NlpC family hydrolase
MLRRTVAASGALLLTAATLSVTAVSVTGLMLSAAPATAAAVSHNPAVHLDSAILTGATVAYRGWAIDPDLPATVRVGVSFDGGAVRSVPASVARPDVAYNHRTFGPTRGFAGTQLMPKGTHTLCWTAVNLGAGSDTRIGCQAFTVPGTPMRRVGPPLPSRRPAGALTAASVSRGQLTVRGWAQDPDTADPVLIDALIGGVRVGTTVANGAHRMFAATFSTGMAPGNYQACAVAINATGGLNSSLGCQVLTVLPMTEPNELGTATSVAAANELQAQAIASGAAGATEFVVARSTAGRIAVAARALLQQATGRRARPAARAGIPAFVRVTAAKPVDEQAVMGGKPVLGSYPAARTGGRTGSSRSLTAFARDPLPDFGGPGAGILGAAAVLPANGTTVHPALPGYPVGYVPLRAEVAVDTALSHLGDPYVWAAAGPSTFDCSGLTQWAYAKAGVSLYHYTGTQAVQGVRVQPNQLLPGDLVLFGSSLHHVGMYVGAGYMIDSPDTGSYVRLDKISWFGDFALAVRP